jgi:pimeloyl-ACP methyl ester carboxylesterase
MKDEWWEERGIAYRANVFNDSRRTLVFIHGLGNTCSLWEAYEAALENDFNILTYDLRGHGFSRRYKSYADYDLRTLADDLQALLGHVGIQSCSLVSSSIGTLVALLYVHNRSETVRSNFLLAPIYKHHSLTDEEIRRTDFPLMNLLSRIPFASRSGKRMDYSRAGHAADLDFGRLFSEIRGLSLRVFLFYLHQMSAFKDHGLWSQMRVPTTIVHGTKDTFAPYDLAVDLSKAIPGARLVTLEGANHLAILNNREEIIERIRNQ